MLSSRFSYLGVAGVWTFGIGFIAAALSSMLTVPLGAVITADTVFTISRRTDTDPDLKDKVYRDSFSCFGCVAVFWCFNFN